MTKFFILGVVAVLLLSCGPERRSHAVEEKTYVITACTKMPGHRQWETDSYRFTDFNQTVVFKTYGKRRVTVVGCFVIEEKDND